MYDGCRIHAKAGFVNRIQEAAQPLLVCGVALWAGIVGDSTVPEGEQMLHALSGSAKVVDMNLAGGDGPANFDDGHRPIEQPWVSGAGWRIAKNNNPVEAAGVKVGVVPNVQGCRETSGRGNFRACESHVSHNSMRALRSE